MLKLNLLKNFLKINNLAETTKRFALPVLCTIFLAAIFIGLTFETFDNKFVSPLTKLSFSLSTAFYAFVALKLYAENQNWSDRKYFLFSALAIAIIALVASNTSPYDGFLLIFGSFLSISAAPFLNKRDDNISYCNFSCSLTSSMFFSLLAAAILSLGTCAILASIHYLFELDINSKIYFSLSILYFIFFAPLYFLSGMQKDSASAHSEYPHGIKFITNFILIPLLATYSIILYVYIIKILISAELPKGVLAIMILSFGSFGILTHFFSYPLSKDGNKLTKLFSQYFYHSLLIPLGFLFIAVLKRVSDYGITEDRYLMILMGLWLLISCVYTILTKAKNLKFVTISLAAMFIAASVGPWGIVGISQFSQVKRLESLLKKEGILVDGKIIKATNPISDESNQEISSIVEYISETHKIEAIKEWFPNKGYVASLSDNIKFVNPMEVMKDMGLQHIEKWQRIARRSVYFFVKDRDNFDKTIIDLKGFDYGIKFNLKNGVSKDFENQNGAIVFNISLEENNLIITDSKHLVRKIDLTNFIDHLRTSNQESKDFILEVKNENLDIKLYTNSIGAELLEKTQITSLEALLLIKE